jgi:hypothetical protein
VVGHRAGGRAAGRISRLGDVFASYRPIVASEQGPRHKRLYDYIRYCENWHRRLIAARTPTRQSLIGGRTC